MAKPKVMYCVMVGDEMYGDSLSADKWGAWSYLGDAQRYCAKEVKPYIARVVITKVATPTDERIKKRHAKK